MSTWQCPACGYSRNTTARKCTKCYYIRKVASAPDLQPQVTLLLREADTRKVRAVIRTDTPLSDALFDIAAAGRYDWDLESWAALTKTLRSCNTKVETWIEEKEESQS